MYIDRAPCGCGGRSVYLVRTSHRLSIHLPLLNESNKIIPQHFRTIFKITIILSKCFFLNDFFQSKSICFNQYTKKICFKQVPIKYCHGTNARFDCNGVFWNSISQLTSFVNLIIQQSNFSTIFVKFLLFRHSLFEIKLLTNRFQDKKRKL